MLGKGALGSISRSPQPKMANVRYKTAIHIHELFAVPAESQQCSRDRVIYVAVVCTSANSVMLIQGSTRSSTRTALALETAEILSTHNFLHKYILIAVQYLRHSGCGLIHCSFTDASSQLAI